MLGAGRIGRIEQLPAGVAAEGVVGALEGAGEVAGILEVAVVVGVVLDGFGVEGEVGGVGVGELGLEVLGDGFLAAEGVEGDGQVRGVVGIGGGDEASAVVVGVGGRDIGGGGDAGVGVLRVGGAAERVVAAAGVAGGIADGARGDGGVLRVVVDGGVEASAVVGADGVGGVRAGGGFGPLLVIDERGEGVGLASADLPGPGLESVRGCGGS